MSNDNMRKKTALRKTINVPYQTYKLHKTDYKLISYWAYMETDIFSLTHMPLPPNMQMTMLQKKIAIYPEFSVQRTHQVFVPCAA